MNESRDKKICQNCKFFVRAPSGAEHVCSGPIFAAAHANERDRTAYYFNERLVGVHVGANFGCVNFTYIQVLDTRVAR